MDITNEQMVNMYTNMVKIRMFESRVAEIFAEGKIPGFVHLYVGEEGVATGVCANLRDTDYITSTHRGHGHCIAKGLKIIGLGLISQYVAIDQKQNPFLGTGFPQPPYDLKCRIGFTGTSGHD